jgi:cytochrome c
MSSFEFSKIAGGLLLAIALGMSLTLISDHIFAHVKLTKPAYDIPVTTDGRSSQNGGANAAQTLASAVPASAPRQEPVIAPRQELAIAPPAEIVEAASAPAPVAARVVDPLAEPKAEAAAAAEVKACEDCEHPDKSAAAKAGPPLFAIVSHPKGAVRGSARDLAQPNSLKAQGAAWTLDALDQFLADPKAPLGATKTIYAGGRDAARRADIIEYLTILSDHPRRASVRK